MSIHSSKPRLMLRPAAKTNTLRDGNTDGRPADLCVAGWGIVERDLAPYVTRNALERLLSAASRGSTHQLTPEGRAIEGGRTSFTSRTSQNKYLTAALTRRRSARSMLTRTRMSRLDCQNIGQTKDSTHSDQEFREAMKAFTPRPQRLVCFFLDWINASNSANWRWETPGVLSRHCTIGVKAPLKAFFRA